MQTFNPDTAEECGALVLHLRPQAAGLEIAVHTGEARWCCDGASRMTLDEGSEVHTVPASADALTAFAARVLETGPPHWLGEEGEVSAWGVRLPSEPPDDGDKVGRWGWSRASVELHAAKHVLETVNTVTSGDGTLLSQGPGLEFEEVHEVSNAPVFRQVHNDAVHTPADPPDTFAQRWRQARDRAAAALAAALAEVLQRAVSKCGAIPPPSPQQTLPPGA